MRKPVLALTQGDPAGIGPEILLRLFEPKSRDRVEDAPLPPWQPLLIAELSALLALRPILPDVPWDRLTVFSDPPCRTQLLQAGEALPVFDPVGFERTVRPGLSGPADAAGAMAALDAGIELARAGTVDALVTAPISKASISHHHLPGFVGHTDYLAAACGLHHYGRDYLMTFLAPNLKVALLSTHVPLAEALSLVRREAVRDALSCLGRHAGGRIAVAGLNPHAGEGGLLGQEEETEIRPAITEARGSGLDVYGPESPDTLFARALGGEFDWVLSLYHDQGLIAVKTADFGGATNWTLGLPFLRTSVDHGTAFGIAGRGIADVRPMRSVVRTTLEMLAERAPATL